MMTRDDIVKVAECFYNFAKEEEPTDNKYELMWEELWAVIAPPNSPCCEMDGAKIYQKATDIFHKYFPPMSR